MNFMNCEIYSFSCVAFIKTEERKRQRQQAKQTHNLLLSIVVFVRKSYLFAVELWTVEINNIMRIVKYEYDEQCEYNIKISMNAYKYQKL